jgi:hypothetical protein
VAPVIRIEKDKAYDLYLMAQQGVGFEEAWRRARGVPYVDAGPFVRELRLQRIERGRTLSGIAASAGVDPGRVQDIASRRQKTVHMDDAKKLCVELGIAPAEVGL